MEGTGQSPENGVATQEPEITPALQPTEEIAAPESTAVNEPKVATAATEEERQHLRELKELLEQQNNQPAPVASSADAHEAPPSLPDLLPQGAMPSAEETEEHPAKPHKKRNIIATTVRTVLGFLIGWH